MKTPRRTGPSAFREKPLGGCAATGGGGGINEKTRPRAVIIEIIVPGTRRRAHTTESPTGKFNKRPAGTGEEKKVNDFGTRNASGGGGGGTAISPRTVRRKLLVKVFPETAVPAGNAR